FCVSATAVRDLAKNPWLSTVVALLFLAFGLSLLGVFEIRLPNSLLNASAQGESRGGLVGVMFMALTLTITSFTCTFPVVGGLIVMAAGGQFFYPIIGLATFSTVLAAVCGVYLLGLFRTDHDHEEVRVGPGRMLLGSLFLGIALFLAPALFGRPPASKVWYTIVGLLPPDVSEFEPPAPAAGGPGK